MALAALLACTEVAYLCVEDPLSACNADLGAVFRMEGSLQMRMVFGGSFGFAYKSRSFPSSIDSVHHLELCPAVIYHPSTIVTHSYQIKCIIAFFPWPSSHSTYPTSSPPRNVQPVIPSPQPSNHAKPPASTSPQSATK